MTSRKSVVSKSHEYMCQGSWCRQESLYMLMQQTKEGSKRAMNT